MPIANPGAIDLPRMSYQTHFKITKNFSEALLEIWRQALVDKAGTVKLGSESYEVAHSKSKRLRQVEFFEVIFEGTAIHIGGQLIHQCAIRTARSDVLESRLAQRHSQGIFAVSGRRHLAHFTASTKGMSHTLSGLSHNYEKRNMSDEKTVAVGPHHNSQT